MCAFKCSLIRRILYFALIVSSLQLPSGVSLAQPAPQIVSTSPGQNELNVPGYTNITAIFDVDMDVSTLHDTNFVVHARSTGLHYDYHSFTATLDPENDFMVGELVTVTLTTDIRSAGGAPLEQGYTWSFTVVATGGSGIFILDSQYPMSLPMAELAADLDGDGDLDLATANAWVDLVTVLTNNGDGTFVHDTAYTVQREPWSVNGADLDADGDYDLVTANHTSDDYGVGDVAVLLNQGDGTFASHSRYPAGVRPTSVFIGDLNGDGHLDLATADSSTYPGSTVSVLLNNGDGTFAAPDTYPLDHDPTEIIGGDLDGDGDLDLATGFFNSANILILLNNGVGVYAPGPVVPVGGLPQSLFVADLDGDGDLELITANTDAHDVSVIPNNGDGSFASPSDYPAGRYPHSIFAADFDGDGDLDLTTAIQSEDGVNIFLNNGDATFAPYVTYLSGGGPWSVFAADFDGDGSLDLAVGNGAWQPGSISILLNQPQCNCFSIGDCDGDGQIGPVDVIWLITYAFRGGQPPPVDEHCPAINRGDWDCNDVINIIDIVKMVNYIYRYPAPGPCDPCECDPYPDWWKTSYEGDVMPSASCPAWGMGGFGDSVQGYVDNGAFHIIDHSTTHGTGYGNCWISESFGDEYTVEYRLKCLAAAPDGDHCYTSQVSASTRAQIFDGARGLTLDFSPTHLYVVDVSAGDDCPADKEADFVNEFHVVRVVKKGGEFYVYLDGSPVTVTAGFAETRSDLRWGSSHYAGVGEGLWDYVRWNPTEAVFGEPVALELDSIRVEYQK